MGEFLGAAYVGRFKLVGAVVFSAEMEASREPSSVVGSTELMGDLLGLPEKVTDPVGTASGAIVGSVET